MAKFFLPIGDIGSTVLCRHNLTLRISRLLRQRLVVGESNESVFYH